MVIPVAHLQSDQSLVYGGLSAKTWFKWPQRMQL